MKTEKNNRAEIFGKITAKLKYDHEYCGEKFYKTEITTMRKSEEKDIIPVIISERLMVCNLYQQNVRIAGSIRTYNRQEGEKRHVDFTFFVNEFNLLDDERNENRADLIGFICRKPVYRLTPLGREICDFILAVPRNYGKQDYVPCIAWGRNARYIVEFETGKHLSVSGRMQSRTYQKKLGEEKYEDRTAYELSIAKFAEVEDEEEETDGDVLNA